MKMNDLEIKGAARIGMMRVTYPFARLKVNKDQLELKTSISGDMSFQASDIVSIEPYTIMPIIGQGIKITHNKTSYEDKVIFYGFLSPKTLIEKIKLIGFLK